MRKFIMNKKFSIFSPTKTIHQVFLLTGLILIIYLTSWNIDPTGNPSRTIINQKSYSNDPSVASIGKRFSSLIHWVSPVKDHSGYIPLGLDTLSNYDFTPTSKDKNSPTQNASIPESIKALNGRKVAVTGYVLPMAVENGRTQSFMLMRNTLFCCYGIMPKMNEWVNVEMGNEKNNPILKIHTPTVVYGTLEVGENYESGDLNNIYRIKAVDVIEVENQS